MSSSNPAGECPSTDESRAVGQQTNQAFDQIASNAHINQANIDIVPTHSLPVELLTHIFSLSLPPLDHHCLFGETFPPRKGGHDPHIPSHLRTPEVLLEVCKYWRAVAINTPSLWTRVLIEDPECPQELRRAAMHFKYSADLPLLLHICNIRPNDLGHRLKPRTALLRLMVPHARRWRELVFSDHVFSIDDLQCFPPASLTALTTASTYTEDPTVNAHFYLWATSSPRLQRVMLHCSLDCIPEHLMEPGAWQGMRDLSLRMLEVMTDEVLDMLQACPRLEMLHVATVAVNSSIRDDDDLPFVECSELRTLLLLSEDEAIPSLFRHISAPQLLHLAIDDIVGTDEDAHQRRIWSPVTEMLTRSGARLRRFFYSGSETQLMRMIPLDCLQALEELTAFTEMARSPFMDLLIIDDEKRFLPLLKDLTLCTYQSSDAEGKLGQMILSRRGVLQVLELHSFPRPYNALDMMVVEEARERGLFVYFGSPAE
ncbi:hypothetical protein GGF50DRAFT_118103 [Schizophyllum commune]